MSITDSCAAISYNADSLIELDHVPAFNMTQRGASISTGKLCRRLHAGTKDYID